jgi:hypothetical protein
MTEVVDLFWWKWWRDEAALEAKERRLIATLKQLEKEVEDYLALKKVIEGRSLLNQ